MFNLSCKMVITFVCIYYFIEYVNADCKYRSWSMKQEVINCPDDGLNTSKMYQCCGWFFKHYCCSNLELENQKKIQKSINFAIFCIIVIAMALIFIAFLVGWVYSCFLITRQTRDIAEIDANGQPTQEVQGQQSFIYSFFTRYFNNVNIGHGHLSSNEASAICALNDKPPRYETLFPNRIGNSSTNCRSTGILIQDNPLRLYNLDESPPPAYVDAVK